MLVVKIYNNLLVRGANDERQSLHKWCICSTTAVKCYLIISLIARVALYPILYIVKLNSQLRVVTNLFIRRPWRWYFKIDKTAESVSYSANVCDGTILVFTSACYVLTFNRCQSCNLSHFVHCKNVNSSRKITI